MSQVQKTKARDFTIPGWGGRMVFSTLCFCCVDQEALRQSELLEVPVTSQSSRGTTLQRAMSPQELVESLASASKEGKRGSEGVQINLDLIETILLYDEVGSADHADHEEGDEGEHPKDPKRVGGRRATGYISKEQVETAVGTHVHYTDGEQEKLEHDGRVKARRATGAISKEKLLQLLENADDDEDEDEPVDIVAEDRKKAQASQEGPAVGKQQTASDRCRNRKGTGFVSKNMLKKVLTAAGEDDE